MRREFNRHYLSLLHFDFPYFNEPDSGCRDEIGLLKWHNNSCKFAGTEIPYDENFAPKFGYRCLHSTGASTYLYADSASIFAFDPANKFTFECFIYPVSSGNIISLYNNSIEVFAVKLADSNIAISGSGYNVSISGAQIVLNAWHHLAVCIESGAIKIYIDGALKQSGTISKSGNITITQARLGGFGGYLDEFLAQDDINYKVPSSPYQGIMNIKTLGGFGTGRHGAASFTTANSNLILNTYGLIKTITNTSTFTVTTAKTGTHGAFAAGDEVIITVQQKEKAAPYALAGMYAFAKIKSISGSSFTLENPVTEFAFNTDTLNNYVLHIIKVPNYASLLIGENVTVNSVNSYGLVVFKVKGDFTLNGKIITNAKNSIFPRYDLIQMCNSELPERFLMNTNGGVIIICGGTFTASSNARIGSTYSGDAKGGAGGHLTTGGNGGAGYGGGGSSSGGNGGVGGGGGGGENAQGGDAGKPGTGGPVSGAAGTGGGGACWTTMGGGGAQVYPSAGGTQGKNLNGESVWVGTGGGGAGGNGGNAYDSKSGLAGANVMLICKTLKCDLAAISTGGGGGNLSDGTQIYATGGAVGGGGTGFCYIACEKMI